MKTVNSHEIFSENAEGYSQARPRYPLPLFEFLAARAPALDRAWDVATGNGQAAVSLARIFGEVYATDSSADQIAHALVTPGVFFSVASAEESGHPDNYFDLITVAQALHWFDLPRFFREVARVAKPGALFAAWGYDWFTINPEIDRLVQKDLLVPLKPYWAPQNQLLWRGYRDILFPFKKLPTPRFEIRERWNLPRLLGYLRSWSATRKWEREAGKGGFRDFVTSLASLWGDPPLEREVGMELHRVAGIIR